jgi:ATP-grasp domain, R2K clade family 3
MRAIFCADPLDRKRPDSMYAAGVEAASAAGFACSLLNFEALTDEQDAEAAVRRIAPAAERELGVYRGWMLRPDAYEHFHAALEAKGIVLLNAPAAYRHCHYLPESYSIIQGQTPRSVWLKADAGLGIEHIMRALRPFGAAPVIVKDYVKSRKHEWAEACYIPSAADRSAVERVVTRFLELQGADLNEGLVFREFVEFEPLAQHSKSGMPLTKEFRFFFLDGELLLATAYWDEGDYGNLQPPLEHFQALARQVRSRFFTMDVAKRLDGDWLIVELGDGQVAGLPERADLAAFYGRLAGRLAQP